MVVSSEGPSYEARPESTTDRRLSQSVTDAEKCASQFTSLRSTLQAARRRIWSPRRLVIRLFGALEIEDGERGLGARDLGGVRPKQVLEILLAARGHRVPTDRIAELSGARSRPADIAGSIQTFVSVCGAISSPTAIVPAQLVVTEPEAYRFATELVDFDLDRFDELLERSAREPTRVARRSLEQALALVRGEVLEDEPYAAVGSRLARQLPGPRPRRAPRRSRRRARRARL